MANSEDKKLTVDVIARIDKLEKAMAKAAGVVKTQTATMEGHLSRLNKTIATVGESRAFEGVASGALLAFAPILSVGAAVEGAKSAMEAFAKVSDEAKAAGLDPEFFQSLAYQAKLGGVSIDETAGALATFAKNAGLAAAGKGRMVATLKALDPVLLETIRHAATQEDRVKAVADALSKQTDAAKKAAIATAAFGELGPKLAGAFAGGADEIESMQVKAKALGLIVNDDVIARAKTLNDDFQTTSEVIDQKLKTALVNLGPILVWLTGLAGNLAGGLGALADGLTHGTSTQLQSTLEARLAEVTAQLNMKNNLNGLLPGLGGPGADDLAKKQAEILAELRKRAVDSLRTQLTAVAPTTPDIPTLDQADAAAKAVAHAEAVKKLIADLKFESEITGETALQQEILNKQHDAGVEATSADGQAIARYITAAEAQKAAIKANAEAMKEFSDVSKAAFSTFITDIEQGKTLAQSLGDVLGQLSNKLVDTGLNALFGTGSGTNPAGLIGQLFFHADGGIAAHGKPLPVFGNGGVSNSAAIFAEAGPEAAVPLKGGKIPVDLRMPKGGFGGSIVAPVTVNIDASGADAAAISRLELSLGRLKAELPATVVAAVRDAKKRRVLA